MRVLITSATSRLSRELAASLSANHDVVLSDREETSGEHRSVKNDLGHDEATNGLVKGVDAIVHSGAPKAGDTVSQQLDYAMRCTYNLLWAAAEEGVRRLVLLSALSVMDEYADDLAVRETWRPKPSTDPAVLCHHLSEYVSKEFARERKIGVVCLRLGELVWDSNAVQPSPAALYAGDASQAVEKALTWEPTGWDILHIQSAVPGARYSTTTAEESLGYSPVRRG